MAIFVAAATAGGCLLHRAAVIERQTLRTQDLGRLVYQLQDISSQAQTASGATAALADDRARALAAADTVFQLIRAHDGATSERIRASYVAYIRGSTRAFDGAVARGGAVPASEQRQVELRLAGFESRIDVEVDRQARATNVTNPHARLALIIAAVAAAFLVTVLIWQFELQRRAGRIDRDTAERSEDLMRLRNDFTAAVSHELRTPLTSILGYLELIRDNDAVERSPEEDAFLAVVQRNAERLMRLVSDLLLVAEVESGMLALEIEDVDLGGLAAECVEAAQPVADGHQIRLSLNRGLSAQLRGDAIRLAQMMDNLVSNAIKFTPVDGHVTVSTTVRNGQAVFEVADSGIGVATSDQAQLFDRFFRTSAAVARATPGTGLGLTITKAIVDAHGGSIDVTSAVGVGTTFRVRLPLSHASPDVPLEPMRSAPTPA
jgi:signal transduction histidine kinase